MLSGTIIKYFLASVLYTSSAKRLFKAIQPIALDETKIITRAS